MKSRAGRFTLLLLFVVALGVTAYLFWMAESLARAEVEAARAFDAHSQAASRLVFDIRMAQQAYVAAGQGGDYWPHRVASGVESLRGRLTELRAAAVSAQAQSEIENASAVLADFGELDRRAREYARTGQNLLASDLVFGDGADRTEAIARGIDEARTSEGLARDAAIANFRNRQVFASASAAAASLLVILLLVPAGETRAASLPAGSRSAVLPLQEKAAAEPVAIDLELEGWSPPKKIGKGAAAAVPADAPAEPPTATAEQPVAAPALDTASTDFIGVASLCAELARVEDTHELQPLLERAAALLDASGIILWMADQDGRELNPVLAQGYPTQLINRLGTIPREAENATAAAFRTSLLQTVRADAHSSGAIAAPLVTQGGCVGVMAAEVRHDGEKQDAKLAAAVIVAAQLASLIGAPATRPQNIGAANA